MSEKVTVMPPKSLGFGFAVLIKSLLLTLAGVSAYAQVQPNIEGGMHAFGSYHGGEVDAVSLSNGNVLYKIPLLSYPQRGGRLGSMIPCGGPQVEGDADCRVVMPDGATDLLVGPLDDAGMMFKIYDLSGFQFSLVPG